MPELFDAEAYMQKRRAIIDACLHEWLPTGQVSDDAGSQFYQCVHCGVITGGGRRAAP